MLPRNLAGQRFGLLTAVSRSASNSAKTKWLCVCDCGGQAIVITNNLLNGNTMACGCRRVTHAKSKTAEYKIWTGMVERCCSASSVNFKNYGALGVSICPEWRDDFTKFLEHVGLRPTPKH